MINEEDLAGAVLAGMEPDQRFRFIEQLAAKRLVSERDINGEHIYDDYDYMSSVLEAARLCRISELLEWDMPRRNGDDWQWACRNFRADATRVSQRILFEHASRPVKDPNTVALDAATKERLRFHLGQVRGIIDNDPMPDWKKKDLYDSISELEREIDKARTRIAAVIDVLSKTWDGDMRAADALRQIVIIIQSAKSDENETAMLAAPQKPKQIEGPKNLAAPRRKSVERKSGVDKPLDDEIPF